MAGSGNKVKAPLSIRAISGRKQGRIVVMIGIPLAVAEGIFVVLANMETREL
jgi:hypothetical protein